MKHFLQIDRLKNVIDRDKKRKIAHTIEVYNGFHIQINYKQKY